MTTFRRILSMLLVTVMALSVSAMATFSPAGTIVNRALEEVTELYTDIYTISDASAYLMNQTMDENGNAVYIVETSFKRTLKAASALEIPAISGMIEAKKQLEDPVEIQAAEEYIAARIADMEENYIGVEQDTNVTLRVTLPAVLPTSASLKNAITHETIEVECGIGEDEYGPLDAIAPRSATEQQETGSALVEEAVSIASLMTDRGTPHNATILDYNRIAARNYARLFSCDKGISTDHPSCHNDKYEFFEGNDCANFVSQCLENGGLPRDSQ